MCSFLDQLPSCFLPGMVFEARHVDLARRQNQDRRTFGQNLTHQKRFTPKRKSLPRGRLSHLKFQIWMESMEFRYKSCHELWGLRLLNVCAFDRTNELGGERSTRESTLRYIVMTTATVNFTPCSVFSLVSLNNSGSTSQLITAGSNAVRKAGNRSTSIISPISRSRTSFGTGKLRGTVQVG